jgi:hypothetical protein
MKILREDLSHELCEMNDKIFCRIFAYSEKDDNGELIVHLEETDSMECQRLNLMHEVIEDFFGKAITHPMIDRLALVILNALLEGGYLK